MEKGRDGRYTEPLPPVDLKGPPEVLEFNLFRGCSYDGPLNFWGRCLFVIQLEGPNFRVKSLSSGPILVLRRLKSNTHSFERRL